MSIGVYSCAYINRRIAFFLSKSRFKTVSIGEHSCACINFSALLCFTIPALSPNRSFGFERR